MFKMSGKKKNIPSFKKSNDYWNHIHTLITHNAPNEEICKNYGVKTLVSGWYLEHSALPFDNASPKKGFSSYKRLGTRNEPVSKMSSSQEDQIKALKPENYRIPDKPRKMMNFMSFPTTFGLQREESFKLAGRDQQDSSFNKTDYMTVTKCDYIYPYPQKPAPVSWNYFQLETKYRRVHTSVVGKNTGKFLDDQVVLKKYFTDTQRPYGLDYKPEDTWKIINMDRKAN
ncbi:uncharacterized protein LOC106670604 [Cimex lectularius]|uniref:Uncharacterized protein n=1 Tax=Cimex lectularius TaxID=79782 RepID=A0A8I6S1S9_CIMLE|nr:uncharacterized protein LOC106670604 [Cimex lectularius]